MHIFKLLGLLFGAALIFIGRLGVSAVASDEVVISPITDQSVSRLVVEQSAIPFKMKMLSDPIFTIEPVNHLEILTEAQPVRQNLAQIEQADPVHQAPNRTCATLETVATELFERSVTKTETPFADKALGMAGIDCQLTVTRASRNPEDYLTIAQELKTSLESTGWHEDQTYIAYGPDEITLALLQDNNSGMLTVGRQALNSTACRGTHSESPCQVGADQYRYEITFSFTVAPLPNNDGITIIRGAGPYNE